MKMTTAKTHHVRQVIHIQKKLKILIDILSSITRSISLSRFYDRWAGDIALTTLSGRQVATDILLATYG